MSAFDTVYSYFRITYLFITIYFSIKLVKYRIFKHINAIACNKKSFAIAIILFSFFFSTANLAGLTEVTCQIFFICETRRVWLNSDILEKHYVTNINTNLKYHLWKYDIPWALEKIIMAEVSGHITKRVTIINVFHGLNLISYTITMIYPKVRILLDCYQKFL